jgi:hypothetical protein
VTVALFWKSYDLLHGLNWPMQCVITVGDGMTSTGVKAILMGIWDAEGCVEGITDSLYHSNC